MFVSMIAAMDRRGLIGDETGLPWHLPKDLRRFRAYTWGKPIIMGRRTFELIGRPLPGRFNIVLTQKPEYTAQGCRVARTLQEALSIAEGYLASTGGDEAVIIGGGKVYAEAIRLWDRCYLTVVGGQFKGDTSFPVRELLRQRWRPVCKPEMHPPDEKNAHGHSFHIIERVREPVARSAQPEVAGPAVSGPEPETTLEESGLAAILARGNMGLEALWPGDGAWPMPVQCELRPLSAATTDQLKALGAAVKEWFDREQHNEGVLYSYDPDDLNSLLLGEPPSPLGSRVAGNHPGVDLERIREDLGSLFSDRSLRFAVKDEPDCTRDKVIESLRQAIPPELVEDIVIGGASWTE
jgi:dihydrofolate reductase